MIKRLVDIAVSASGLVMLAPAMLAIGASILVLDGQPVLFRQRRVGRFGRQFTILKFRSMTAGNRGASITAGSDARITRIGRVLRRYKLDELPQLWNVLKGDMSVVGPRPEVAEYVNMKVAAWHEILEIRPGLADFATLVYRDEERLLAEAENPRELYLEEILPSKLELSRRYLRARSLYVDLKVLLVTVFASVFPVWFDAASVTRFLGLGDAPKTKFGTPA